MIFGGDPPPFWTFPLFMTFFVLMAPLRLYYLGKPAMLFTPSKCELKLLRYDQNKLILSSHCMSASFTDSITNCSLQSSLEVAPMAGLLRLTVLIELVSVQVALTEIANWN